MGRTWSYSLLVIGLALAGLTSACAAQPTLAPAPRSAAAPLQVARPAEDVVFVIPSGTFAAETRGEPIFTLPSTIRVHVGQGIVIQNDDQAMHYFFDVPVAPGQSFRKAFNQVGSFGYSPGLSCSLAQSGSITVEVSP
jgi:hypothetical protein